VRNHRDVQEWRVGPMTTCDPSSELFSSYKSQVGNDANLRAAHAWRATATVISSPSTVGSWHVRTRVWPPILQDGQSSFFKFVRLGQCVELIVPNVYMTGATDRIPPHSPTMPICNLRSCGISWPIQNGIKFNRALIVVDRDHVAVSRTFRFVSRVRQSRPVLPTWSS